eukprot:3265288-Amphidinium_carterae.1
MALFASEWHRHWQNPKETHSRHACLGITLFSVQLAYDFFRYRVLLPSFAMAAELSSASASSSLCQTL